jgi:hypothetical protein
MFRGIDLNELDVELLFRALATVGSKISRVVGSNPENLLVTRIGIGLFFKYFIDIQKARKNSGNVN